MRQRTFRIVSDYGYGDKTWLERFLSYREVEEYFRKHRGYTERRHIVNLFENSDSLYYFEEDHHDDVENWDWLDS